MKLLSTKGVYGLMAIYEIAKSDQTSPMSMKSIADKLNISKNYLEQILNPLRTSGIISSVKGKVGGYYLNKSLDEITFLDIFQTLENGFTLTDLKIQDEVFSNFFAQMDLNLRSVFDKPLKEFIKFDTKNREFLNYII